MAMELNITREEFKAYVDCQKSGVTNMFQTTLVQKITGLDPFTQKYIMLHYNQLKKKFEGEEDGETRQSKTT